MKGECKHLTDGCPVETALIIRLHVLVRDAQEVFYHCGIILRDVEKNKSFPRADIAVIHSTVDHVREYLSDYSGNEASGIKLKRVSFLVDHIASQVHLV